MLAVTAALTLPTLGYGFVYEDLNDLETFQRPWTWAQTAAMPLRSLTSWTYTLSMWAGAGAPWAYHAGNVSVHLLNVLLLAALGGVWAAALFAVHPLNVETVAYVSARPDALAVTGVLLALLAARRGWWVLAALSCGLATLSKESALVAWGLVPFVAWWEGRRFPRWWVDVLLVPVALVLVRVCWTCGASAAWPLTFSLDATMQTAGVIVRYLAWTAVPVGLALTHDWAWLTPAAAVGLVATAGALVAVSRQWFAAAWVLLALAPRLLIPYGDGLHDHHWYLPMVGISLAFGAWQEGRTA